MKSLCFFVLLCCLVSVATAQEIGPKPVEFGLKLSSGINYIDLENHKEARDFLSFPGYNIQVGFFHSNKLSEKLRLGSELFFNYSARKSSTSKKTTIIFNPGFSQHSERIIAHDIGLSSIAGRIYGLYGNGKLQLKAGYQVSRFVAINHTIVEEEISYTTPPTLGSPYHGKWEREKEYSETPNWNFGPVIGMVYTTTTKFDFEANLHWGVRNQEMFQFFPPFRERNFTLGVRYHLL